jgi:uncharacterized protein
VRDLARALGLPNWDKPAAACLSSRIPPGTPVTFQRLAQVEQAETILRGLGLRQVRVRHHGEVARLEVDPADFDYALKRRKSIVERLTAVGYTFVALDLNGYRTGSLNRSPIASRGGSHAAGHAGVGTRSALTLEAAHGS